MPFEKTKDTECGICGDSFDRNDLEYVALGNDLPPNLQTNFYACHPCAILEKLNWYKTRYELSRDTEKQRIEENNLFRTLLLSVETMKSLSNDSDVLVKSYIRQHRPGWESLPFDTLLFFLDLYQKHAEEFSTIINRKASKDEIKAYNERKTKEGHKVHATKVAEAKEKKEASLPKTPENKVILGWMKSLRLTKEQATQRFNEMFGVSK